jgi:hypothetical protein
MGGDNTGVWVCFLLRILGSCFCAKSVGGGEYNIGGSGGLDTQINS